MEYQASDLAGHRHSYREVPLPHEVTMLSVTTLARHLALRCRRRTARSAIRFTAYWSRVAGEEASPDYDARDCRGPTQILLAHKSM